MREATTQGRNNAKLTETLTTLRRCVLASCLRLCVAIAATAAIASCKPKAADPAAKPAGDSAQTQASTVTLPVVGEAVRKGDLVISVVTTGQVRSEAMSVLKSETQGTIASVLVRPGDHVKKGQPLLQVDPRPLDLAVKDAEAQLDRARLQLLDNTVPDSIVTGKALTGERLRNAEIRSGLDAAKVTLEKAKLEREKATVTAPFDGVMDEVKVSTGERLAMGQDIGKIVDLDHLRIEAAVLEHDLPLIRVGGQAVVTTAAAPDHPVIGTIAAVLPLVDSATRAGRAVIRAGGGGVLRPGMYADVRLEASRLPNRIIVPASAVIERDGRPLVFVVKESRAQWVYINPGRSNGAETEVLPDSSTGQIPLNPGDLVLVEGHLTLTHDAPVRVVVKEERDGKTERRKDGKKP